VIVTDYKKAPTIPVLNSVLPRVLLYDATNLTPEHHRHYAEVHFRLMLSFTNSLLEKLGPAQPIQDAEVTFLSLRQVTVVRRALAQMNPLIPRSKLRFDDVSHRTTPYLLLVCTDNLDQENVPLYLQNIYAWCAVTGLHTRGYR
ncbi:hypothetical protein JG688_00017919, partial [Phytophthora aleatoria]